MRLFQGFEEAIRRYVCGLLCSTYRTCPKAVLGEALNLEGAQLAAYLTKQAQQAAWRDMVRPRSASRCIGAPRPTLWPFLSGPSASLARKAGQAWSIPGLT